MDQRINPLNSNQGKQAGGNQAQTARQRSINQRNAAQQNPRTVGSSTSYSTTRTPGAIRVGEILKGEITDLRNNQISLTLEDNTVVRAQIQDSSKYSIGQTGAFRLTDIAGNTLYLENISLGYSDTELNLINKALDEANLPSTPYNQETVKALMDNLLPINRESIQHLMQQAYDYNTKDMNTLAVMNRLMLPLDEDSIKQFSNYRNDNYDLVERIQNFSRDIPSLLGALAQNSSSDAVATFGKQLLSIALPNFNTNTTNIEGTIASLPEQVQKDIVQLLSNAAMTEDIMEQLDNKTLPLQDAMTLIRDAALNGTITPLADSSSADFTNQLNALTQALEPMTTTTPNITEDFVKSILTLETDTTATTTLADSTVTSETNEPVIEPQNANQDAEPQTQSRFAFASKFLQNISENAKNAINDTLETIRPAEVPKETNVLASNTSLDILTETFSKFARNNDFFNSYMSLEERTSLANELQKMPISQSILHKIASGEATTKDVLTVIYNTISLSDTTQVTELFQSDAFQNLFAKHLQSNWTITPDQLKNGNLSEFYAQMRQQIQNFENLIQSTLSGNDTKELGNYAHDMNSNINFMNTLSETFSFFQMPLKLQSQDAHSELYVYTQKNKIRQNPEKASVLLHLDMEHLGTIDIKLDKNHNDILADFSLNDEDSVNLFRINEDMLKNALNAEGFSCQMQFKQKEAPSPTVDDFINTKVNTHATTDMKRFSFDIRA